jgi:hypothetical protein
MSQTTSSGTESGRSRRCAPVVKIASMTSIGWLPMARSLHPEEQATIADPGDAVGGRLPQRDR